METSATAPPYLNNANNAKNNNNSGKINSNNLILESASIESSASSVEGHNTTSRKGVCVVGASGFIGHTLISLLQTKAFQKDNDLGFDHIICLRFRKSDRPQNKNNTSINNSESTSSLLDLEEGSNASSSSSGIITSTLPITWFDVERPTNFQENNNPNINYGYRSDEITAALRQCFVLVNLIGAKREGRSPIWKKNDSFEYSHVSILKYLVYSICVPNHINNLIHISVINSNPNQTPTFPRFPYLDTKHRAEKFIQSLAAKGTTSGMNWSIIRPGVVFGEGDDTITNIVRSVKFMPLFPIVTSSSPHNKEAMHQPVHVLDLSRVIADVISSYSHHHNHTKYNKRVVEVVGPEVLTVKEMIERVSKSVQLPIYTIPAPNFAQRMISYFMEKVMSNPLSTSSQINLLIRGTCSKSSVNHGITDDHSITSSSPSPSAKSLEPFEGRQPIKFDGKALSTAGEKVGPLAGMSMRMLPGSFHYNWSDLFFSFFDFFTSNFIRSLTSCPFSPPSSFGAMGTSNIWNHINNDNGNNSRKNLKCDYKNTSDVPGCFFLSVS